MKKALLVIQLLLLTTLLSAQLVNINPNLGEAPWLVYAVSPVTPEIQAEIDQVPKFILSLSSAQTTLPEVVDNSQEIYMRSVFSQEDGCCGQASGIGYTYTYEINRLRNLPADTTDNQYPTHFTYNIVKNYDTRGSWYHQGWQLINQAGCPNVTQYGGEMYPSEMMPWRSRVWESDYDLYKNAMQNRTSDWYLINATTPEGLNELKHWLNDHNEDSTSIGGLACFATYMDGETNWEEIDSVTFIATAIDTDSGYHAMTIVGYNDLIGWDFNNDDTLTNSIDLNGDSIINMQDWELGAVKIVNSWGPGWTGGHLGYSHIPYRFFADTNVLGNPTKVKTIMVVNAEDNENELLLLKTAVAHTHRENLVFKTGYAFTADATQPIDEKTIGIFDNHGGLFPMQSRFENDTTPLECALDFGQFYLENDFGKLYLIINEEDDYDTCSGRIASFSIVDYRWNEEFELNCGLNNITIENDTDTYLSVDYDLIVPGDNQMIVSNDTLFSDMVSRFNPTVDSNSTLLVEQGVSIDMYNSDITVNSGSTLTLEDSVTIIAKRDTCRVTIDGEINIGKHINFIADDSALLEIHLNNDKLISSFDSVYFERCKIFHYGKELKITNSEFVDCQRIYSGNGKVTIDSCELTKTGIHIYNNEEADFLSSISNCELSTENTGTLPGIYLQGCVRFNIFNNNVSGYFTGIDIRFSGSDEFTDKKVYDNTIDSCIFNGISTYYSVSLIEGNNI